MVFAKQPNDPPIFPTHKHKTEWWEEDSSPPLKDSKDVDNATNEKTNSNAANNYGSTGQFDEEEPAGLLLDNIVNVSFPSTGGNSGNHYDEFGGVKDVPSDISNNSITSDEEDGSSVYSDEDDDDIEPPHRTCGLIFFDFLRFVAVSADMRLINTEIFPVFLDWKKMDILHISLRVLMTVLTLLLLLVEFPSFFPFLRLDYVPGETPPFSISNWIPRGVFYIFLALVSFEQSIVVRAMDEEKHADTFSRFFNSFFIFVSAWCMLVVGLLYVILGAFCVQKIMIKVRREERKKWKEYYERLHILDQQIDDEEESAWMLENPDSEGSTFVFCQGCQRWSRRCQRRLARGRGLGTALGCRMVDLKC